MGNCIRKGSASEWSTVSRDIKSPAPETQFSGKTLGGVHDEEKIKVEGEKIGREIKIKITKKQLEELLGKVEVQGLPVQLLLAELISKQVDQNDDDDSDHQRSWRPTLQSIPE